MTSLARDVISRAWRRAWRHWRQADRDRSPEQAKFRILKIGPLLAEIQLILWSEVSLGIGSQFHNVFFFQPKSFRMGGGGYSHFKIFWHHTIIYHQFVWLRVREEPHWQGASNSNAQKINAIFSRQTLHSFGLILVIIKITLSCIEHCHLEICWS